MFPSFFMVSKLSKKMHFYNLVLTSARNLSLLKQFTYMDVKVSSHSSENDMGYRVLGHHSWDISNQNIKKDADSVEI